MLANEPYGCRLAGMYGHQLPHPEATVLGCTLAEFRTLSDEQVQEMHDQLQSVAGAERDGILSEAAIAERMFNQFVYYRRYGVPDREISDDELVSYMSDRIDLGVYENVHFGILPLTHGLLTEESQIAAETIVQYLAGTYHPVEMPTIDQETLYEALAVSPDMLDGLLGGLVLKQLGVSEEYALHDEYYAYWLCNTVAEYYLVE